MAVHLDGHVEVHETLAGQAERTTPLRMKFSDGWGSMDPYEVMPGVKLVFNDFHTCCEFPNEGLSPDLVKINHCRTGRFECTTSDGRIAWLGPQDVAVCDMSRPTTCGHFSRGVYQGISLIIDPAAAEKSLFQMLGSGAPRLCELFKNLFETQPFLVLRSEPSIQHIFSEMYRVPSEGRLAYYKIKTAELMIFLQERQHQVRRAGDCSCSSDLTERVRRMAERMTADLRVHVSAEELADEYNLGKSTVKKYFRELYGEPPYAYLKRRRMEEAAFLLTATEQNVTQISKRVGYQNASKFSAAFRDIYGQTPIEYKKMRRPEFKPV